MKKYWNLSLGISLAIHTVALCGMPFPNFQHPKPKDKTITELKMFPEKIEKINAKQNIPNLEIPPPYVERNMLKKMFTENGSQPALHKPHLDKERTKSVMLNDLPSIEDLKKIPGYLDYYRLIRDDIRKNAYYYYDSARDGEVFLSFIILRSGDLETLSLNEDSSPNNILRKIALKSIKQAAPFPRFPDELAKYARLKFNISIHFKNN